MAGNGQQVIENMGLFWRRDLVRWKGDRGVGPARLAGVRSGSKRQGEVNFWGQVGVYALYADYKLVYVGQAGLSDTSCIGDRMKYHLTHDLAGRWNMFSWFGQRKVKANNDLGRRFEMKFTTRSAIADVLEGILIEVAEPPMNNQRGRFGNRVEHYLQVDDRPQDDGITEWDISQLESRLKKYIKKWQPS